VVINEVYPRIVGDCLSRETRSQEGLVVRGLYLCQCSAHACSGEGEQYHSRLNGC
jgi:hypothetical protein